MARPRKQSPSPRARLRENSLKPGCRDEVFFAMRHICNVWRDWKNILSKCFQFSRTRGSDTYSAVSSVTYMLSARELITMRIQAYFIFSLFRLAQDDLLWSTLALAVMNRHSTLQVPMPDLSLSAVESGKKKIGVTAEHLSSSQVFREDAIQDPSEKSFRGAHLLKAFAAVLVVAASTGIMDARARRDRRDFYKLPSIRKYLEIFFPRSGASI